MGRSRNNKYSLRGSSRDAFRLQTRDVSDRTPFFSKRRQRAVLAHWLEAGGTQSTRVDPDAYPIRRSWERFAWAMTILGILWLLGYFWP